MKIKTFFDPSDAEINKFMEGRDIVDIKITSTCLPHHFYADGRGCDIQVIHTYVVMYKD